MPREVEEKGTKGTGQKGFNLAHSLMFPLLTAHVMCACVCMCCVPLAGTGEGWVKVVGRKVKKRKREAVLRDRKEEEGKGERGEGLLPGHPAAGDDEGSENVAADGGSEYA